MTINSITATLGTIRKRNLLVAGAFTFSVIVSAFVYHNMASAASTQAMVRFDRMSASTATTGTVCLTPANTGSVAKVAVTFPTGYTVSTTAGNWTVNTTNTGWPTGGTAWPGIGTATTAVGQLVTFPSTTLTVGTLYCFNWTNTAAVSQPAGAASSEIGQIQTQVSAGTAIDTASYATATVTSDQIAVSASVAQTFSFALSGTADTLGALTTGAVSTSPTPRTATVNTNAKNGWQVWAQDTYAGLCAPSVGTCTSGTPTTQIASTASGSNRTLTAGTTDYNTGVTGAQAGGTGTLSVAAPFVGTGAGQGGGLSATALQSLASSNGTASNAVLTLKNNVAISGAVAAASDYADTITIVAAGLF